MTDEELELIRVRLATMGRSLTADDVAGVARELGLVVSDALVLYALERLRRTSIGAGPLEPLLHLPGVTDVLVNGPDAVYIDRGQGLERREVTFASDDEVRRLAARLAASVGRRIDDATPFVDARLPDGTRVHAVLSVLADPGTCLSLRVPARGAVTLDQLVAGGSLHPDVATVLEATVLRRRAFLISGGTGSGKTTLLAALLGLVPARERLVICEDSRELAPDHPHCVRLESRLPNAEGAGAVDLTTLVRQALRMRPDRLIVGEVRGAELCDLLAALNTGHEGGCGTVHANSVADVPARLEALASLGGLDRSATHAQVAAALHLVIHVTRAPEGARRVSQVGLVRRRGGQEVWIEEAVSVDAHGQARGGPAWDDLQELLR
ncbi:MAG TPA: TadA family conjugal transfer-associated ATPase [Propionibacteriaceae bacterium]|nr:TadA family conjugal transfer-associated ATPase [Propionibacteriaceae bacterium]